MLKNVILFDKATSEHALSYKDFREMGKDISDAELDEIKKTLSEYDVVNMQYTSGTTGFPKGVMLTHHNIANNAYLIANQMKLSEKRPYVHPLSRSFTASAVSWEYLLLLHMVLLCYR